MPNNQISRRIHPMSKRQILITNDDGIRSDGLLRLVRTAREFGDVTVIAPESERSAASHSITLRHPVEMRRVNFGADGVKELSEDGSFDDYVTAYSLSGTPADCVRVGCFYLKPDGFDVVLSGINYGYNVSRDIQYSATVGAACEGECNGCLSIAFSEGLGDCHEVTDRYLKEMMSDLIEKEYRPGYIYNVNFPGCKLSDCKGILRDREVSRTSFFTDRYAEVEKLPDGGLSLMVNGIYNPQKESGTDYGAVLDNYVSVGLVKNLC